MSKRLLVTGFSGFVAGIVIANAKDDWDVHTIGRGEIPKEQGKVKYYNLDLLDTKKFTELYKVINPDVVIHAAALADIDFCQNNKELAEKVNVGVTQSLTMLCKESGAKMILCSTDTVFDGEKGMYTEDNSPNPINFYAETKVKAEDIVRDLDNGVVARLSLVMGLPAMGSGNSFLARTIERLKLSESVKFPENEIRTPVDVLTLAQALLELAGNEFTGTIHLSGNDRLTRYDMAKRIAVRLGYSPNLIFAINSNDVPGRAPRPDDASLDNSRACQLLKTPMCNLMEGLDLILNFERKYKNERS